MDSSEATIGLVGTIVGAVIGAIVSIFAVYLASKRQRAHSELDRRDRSQTALALVQAEIDHNQSVLADYMKVISLDNPARVAANQSGDEWASSHASPVWSTLAWESGMADLIGTVPEAKLLRAFSLYTDLRAFTRTTELAVSYFRQRPQADAVTTAFSYRGKVARRIQEYGNPLR